MTGGSASQTISRPTGSTSWPSASLNHVWMWPFPLGAPIAQPTQAGSKRMSKRSISGATRRTSSGAMRPGTHSSIGGRIGSSAVVWTSSGNACRSPYVASAVIRVAPSWPSSAATVATLPPSRSSRVEICAGPGVEADRK